MAELSKFQEYLKSQNLSPNTTRNYFFLVGRFFKDYSEDTIENINIFSTNTMRRFALIQWLKFNKREEEIKELKKVRRQKVQREGVYLSREQLMQIVNSLSDQTFKIVALIQYLTGARASDVLRTEYNKITKTNGIDGIGLKMMLTEKGGFERASFILEQFSDLIWEFIVSVGKKYPFLRGDSTNLSTLLRNNYHYYYTAVKQTAQRLGFQEFRTHDFRRNFADDVYDMTKDLRITKEALGHHNINWTLRYLKKTVDEKELTETLQKVRG